MWFPFSDRYFPRSIIPYGRAAGTTLSVWVMGISWTDVKFGDIVTYFSHFQIYNKIKNEGGFAMEAISKKIFLSLKMPDEHAPISDAARIKLALDSLDIIRYPFRSLY